MLVKFKRNGHVCPGFLFIKKPVYYYLSQYKVQMVVWNRRKSVRSIERFRTWPFFSKWRWQSISDDKENNCHPNIILLFSLTVVFFDLGSRSLGAPNSDGVTLLLLM